MGELDTNRSESNDSDLEFWTELDKKPPLQNKIFANFAYQLFSQKSQQLKDLKQKSSIPDLNPEINIKNTTEIGSNWSIEILKEKLTRIRQAKDEELAANSIVIRNRTKNHYKDMFKELETKYTQDIGGLINEYEELKMLAFYKDKTIAQLTSMLIDLEIFFSTQRLDLKSLGTDPNKSPKENPGLQFSQEIINLSNQIENMKEVCLIYQEDTNKAKEKAKKAKEKKEKLKKFYEKEIENLKNNFEMKEKEWEEVKQRMEIEFEKYKKNAEKELEVRELIDNRAKEHIKSLQEELKNAKVVMQNPRLRMKIREKLSEYMADHEKSLNESMRPASVLPSQNFHRRRIHHIKNRSSANQNASFDLSSSLEEDSLSLNGIFARKISTPYCAPSSRRKAASSSFSYGSTKTPTPTLM
ncbi:unnamed protein product [Blepharisma stoltei]|uniref:Uncharacterized protein n=1 Tax=Blepharisma stoltei TaxID=1481888 RepID=A0AAU9J736_9CILI|nr:unnamed protein product [Blepharisma stoltei]